jgi:hypothetical protein
LAITNIAPPLADSRSLRVMRAMMIVPIQNRILPLLSCLGAWGHEGFGYPVGVGTGHESLAREAAGEPQNDPYKRIESLVSTDRAMLENTIADIVVQIGDDITLRSADDNPINGGPKNNYSRPLNRPWEYFWEQDRTTGAFRWVRYNRYPLGQEL